MKRIVKSRLEDHVVDLYERVADLKKDISIIKNNHLKHMGIDINTQSNIQTPPLPTTPQPVATSNIMPQVNPTTKLTSVESALLSPTEQAIRQTQRS